MISHDPPVLAHGDRIAPAYTVVAPLRRGRALDVYDVWSEERECRCIAKSLRPDHLTDTGARRRLLGEGRKLGAFTHPHIVRCYETLTEPHPLVVLETVGGETLGHLITQRRRRLPASDLAHLGLQLRSAVRYLHRYSVLHLDLKPSNTMVEGGLAKVLDLSIARRPGRAPSGVGTVQYMAPEQERGGVLTAAADVWGIGVVLYEAATGVPALERAERHRGVRRAEPVLRHRRLPCSLAALIDDCLNVDPIDRPDLDRIGAVLRTLADERAAGPDTEFYVA